MTTLRDHLKHAQTHMNHARAHLESARKLADTPRWRHQWLGAIDKALCDNEEAWLHIGNIHALVKPLLIYSPSDPEGKEN